LGLLNALSRAVGVQAAPYIITASFFGGIIPWGLALLALRAGIALHKTRAQAVPADVQILLLHFDPQRQIGQIIRYPDYPIASKKYIGSRSGDIA